MLQLGRGVLHRESVFLNGLHCVPRQAQMKGHAIDEVSINSGNRYVTLVLDLESGVVFVGQGKSAKPLDPFWVREDSSHCAIP